MNNKSGKFVRIQLDGSGFISFTEIELLGIEPGPGSSGEICGNGEDDDCDGKIDCEDNDCAPVIAHVTKVNPSCPTCEDGQIRVNVANKRGSEVLYSIDNGSTYVEFNRAEENSPVHLFDDLGEGTYNLVVKNDICEVRYVNNPVVLAATAGILTSDCGNGDLETGEDGWTFERYSVQDGDLISSSSINPDFSEYYVLPTEGFIDPLVPDINGTWSALGEYILQLGAPGPTSNPSSNRQNDDLNVAEFCFIINEDNQDFTFIYAPVLLDGHDDSDEKPFFQYDILINGQNVNIGDKIISDDGFFDDGPANNLKFKSWTCAFHDLSEYLGSEACIKFSVRDCDGGAHYGYAYIDGLCTDSDLLNPEIEILTNDIYCSDEPVSLTVDGGGYSSYQWKVGKINGNSRYHEFEFPLQESEYNASFSDVLSDYASASGFTEECVMYFAELSVFGDCGTTTETVQFERSCVNNVVDYCDNLLACTTAHDEINFEGEIDCEGCIFDWQPDFYFVDNTVALPTVKAELLSGLDDVFDRDYFLTYTAPDGCEDMRTVTVGKDDFDISIEGVHTLCLSTYTVAITFDFEINPSVVERIFALDARNDNFIDEGTFILSTNNSLIYEIEVDRSRELGDIQPYYYIDFDFSSLDDVCLIGEDMTLCSKEGWLDEVNENIFSKPWVMWTPLYLDPYNSFPDNRVFRPYFYTFSDSDNECPSGEYEGSSIYWAKLTIYADQGGSIVFEKESDPLPDDATFGLTGREVQWDGTVRCNDGLGFCGGLECVLGLGPANSPGPEHRCWKTTGSASCTSEEDPNCYRYHEDNTYIWILRIRSCSQKKFGNCGWGFPCDSDDGYYCSDVDMEEEVMFTGSVDKWSYAEGN